MEYLRSYIGKTISGYIRLDHSEEEYSYFQSLGLHLQFIGEKNGIQVITDNMGNEIICSISPKNQLEEEKLDGYGFLHNPKTDDHLNVIIGKELKAIRLGQHNIGELQGNGFAIQRGELQAVIFEFENKELLIMNSGNEIWTEADVRIKTEKLELGNIHWRKIK
ncbi:hypothetical protein [Rufibacter immobilis]|uniref:hypothetical protein n=1 Tax=Rufibacter immobilis TaxID=1348778 RepID=UPI0035E63905